MKRLVRLRPVSLQKQAGISLIENLIAVSILAAIGVVFMGAMYTGYRSTGILDEQVQAETLIRTQLEAIKNTDFSDAGVYPVTVSAPPHYSISISVGYPSCIGTADNCTVLVTDTLQEITVYCYHDNKYVLSVSCYKAKQ